MIILGDFSKQFQYPALKFRAIGRKIQLLGNVLRKFSKISWENSKECIILDYSQQNLKSLALIFRAFGRKIQIVGKIWENFENFWYLFNRKIEFLSSFWKVAKNRAFENNIIFLQQFFQFREGNVPNVPPPWRRLW